MILSFTARAFCVAVVVTGLIHLLLEGLLWLASARILRRLETLSARQRERVLYALQLGPLGAGLLLTGCICIPRYILAESNHEAERVGWLCITAALAVMGWYGSALLRGARIAARTLHFAHTCRRTSSPVPMFGRGTPILSYAGNAYGIALVGFFRPFILISESLLGGVGLSHQAIDIALDHETAHAVQFDNWKLLSLCCLPSLGFRLSDGKNWAEMWRTTAEWAADDDAGRGDQARLLVLAETLVAVARRGEQHPRRVCMALECNQAQLVVRVDRLIDPPSNLAASWSRVCGVAFGVAGVVGAALAVMLSSHELLEHLLHLGHG